MTPEKTSESAPENQIQAVLFDLDGTLADTAPDLVGALNRLRSEEGLSPVPLERLRAFASQGARGLLREGLGISREAPDYDHWAERFHTRYAEHLCVDSCLFEGVSELVDTLERQGILWGIVTNKHRRFAAPLVKALKLDGACLVCGDCTPHPKPAPDPILHACQLIGVPSSSCIYVGDDLRDIQSGNAAQAVTLAAAWGYLGSDLSIEAWQADGIIEQPLQTLHWINGERA